jgi:putative spermidine/putrescine transport system ATP-binding protein
MGGHNILAVDGRTVSVRADRIRLSPADGAGRKAKVREIEYQGSAVLVSLAADEGVDLTAIVPERTFYERPFAAGDIVALDWDRSDIWELAA